MSAKRDATDPMEARLGAQPEPDLTDPENPEWTRADFARGKGPESLPPEILAQFPKTRTRGPQKGPTKTLVSLRLSPRIIAYFKADNPAGWQQRLSAALEKVVEQRG